MERSGSLRHPSVRQKRERGREREGGRSGEVGVSQVGSIDSGGGGGICMGCGGYKVHERQAGRQAGRESGDRGDWGEQNKQLPQFWICRI